MSDRSSVAVLAWWFEQCPSCERPVAVLRVGNESTLRLRLADKDASWLARGRHPAYASHFRPLLKGLAQRSLSLKLSGSGSGTVSCEVIACVDGELRRGRTSPALALLMFEAGLPLYVDEELLRPSDREHLEEVINAFTDFVEGVSADDFARFDAGHPG